MLSQKDSIILDLLQKNAKYSSREISDKTGIPITTVHNRIKRMEKEGIIKKYSAVPDKKKLGKLISAYIHVAVTYMKADGTRVSQEDVARTILRMPEVEECVIITGTTDIILKVSTKDVDELNDFVINRLREIDGVQSTVTSIVLKDAADL